MKRITSFALVLILALSALAGCGGPKEKDYTLATGVVVTEELESSKITQTVASIVTDADGKIVLCRLDCVDYTAYDGQGAIVTAAPTSKVALGDAYGATMPKGSFAKQAAALEASAVGKTQAEVAALVNEAGKAADTDLAASCSIYIGDLIKAIDNAFKSEHKVSFKSDASSLTAGLFVKSSVTVTEGEKTGITNTATFATAVLAKGKVVAAILDTAEPELVGVSADGSESLSYDGSKREQGDEYKMSTAWYVQADAYAAAAVGKTAADIATLATEGIAGCTMKYTVHEYKVSLEAAVKTAR